MHAKLNTNLLLKKNAMHAIPPADSVPNVPLRAAMKLPEGARRKSGRPQLPGNKGSGHRSGGGRPQRDAERRAGKSRKVH